MSKYTDLLKDPKWQRKRLEIMNRDSWKCGICQDDSEMLVVHHKYYDKDKMPWQYPDKAYITLCFDCHNELHKDQKQLHSDIIEHFKRSEFSMEEVWEIAKVFKYLKLRGKSSSRLILALRVFLEDENSLEKILADVDKFSIEQLIILAQVTQDV